MINIIISGPYGRMGQALCRLVNAAEDLTLAGGLVPAEHASDQSSAVEAAIQPSQVSAKLSNFISGNAQSGQPFVLIDFTAPGATLQRIREAAELNIPVVIGTTGFTAEQQAEIKEISQQIPIVLAANMSVGVNVLLGMVQDLAARLQGYDIEVIETHHRLKKDAPSGTAIAFANAAAKGRDVQLDAAARHGREGFTGERTADEIGIHAIRGGDVVGDHTVLFAGTGERIEITHKASSRDAFASGALTAARFLSRRSPGLYSMRDALSEKK